MDAIHSQFVKAIGPRLMLAFEGFEPPSWVLSWIKERRPAGFTLFRPINVADPGQIRALTSILQQTAAETHFGPLLIAADQEGGQLVALSDQTTQFPGNMALGATRDPHLAFLVGQAQGKEMAALGVNVNYAPVCDVNTNLENPNVGARAFGDDPQLVADMAKAMIDGLQSTGVAATAKHFPGNGDLASDPHYDLPLLAHDAKRLEAVEFLPFQAAVQAGTRLIMTAHVSLPALTGRSDLPATLSRDIMVGLLREKVGFNGLLITDAFDMKAITQGAGQIVDAIAAIRAGVDLLLLSGESQTQERIFAGLMLAHSRGLLRDGDLLASNKRLLSLRRWLSAQVQPELDVVACAEHRQLSKSVALRSLTLVRDHAGLLPLDLGPDARILTIMPWPADLTPADTSSYLEPGLASAIRLYHPNVDEILIHQRPSPVEIAALRDRISQYSLIIVGTMSAHLQPEQAVLVEYLLATGVATITVALRTPYDLTVYPASQTHICTYGIQEVSMDALAGGLFGAIPFRGTLPVSLPGDLAA